MQHWKSEKVWQGGVKKKHDTITTHQWGHSISNPKTHAQSSFPFRHQRKKKSFPCLHGKKSLCMSSAKIWTSFPRWSSTFQGEKSSTWCQGIPTCTPEATRASVPLWPWCHRMAKESWEIVKKTRDPQIFSKNVHHFTLHGFFFLLAHSKLISLYRMSVIFLTWSSGISQRRCRVLLCRPAASYNISTGTIHQAKGTKDIFSYMFSSIPWDVSMLENKATTDDCPNYRAA